MNDGTIETELERLRFTGEHLSAFLAVIRFPCMVIGTRAGLGNRSAAEALAGLLSPHGDCSHEPIEELFGATLIDRHFRRYRRIATGMPGLLALNFPPLYGLRRIRDRSALLREEQPARERLAAGGFETVVSTSPLALGWLKELERSGTLRSAPLLVGLTTDYKLSSGWRALDPRGIALLAGPAWPAGGGSRYFTCPIPVDPRYQALPPPRSLDVLITGGGWGLGDLRTPLAEIRSSSPGIGIHVICGDNDSLRSELEKEHASHNDVHIHGALSSLLPLMESCAAVVTKPGGVTITEAALARRKIFLVPGLPGAEEGNARYAVRHLGAEPYSLAAFGRWMDACLAAGK